MNDLLKSWPRILIAHNSFFLLNKIKVFALILLTLSHSNTAIAAPSLANVQQPGSTKALDISWSGHSGSWVAIDRSYPSASCGGTCYENVAWINSRTARNWRDTSVEFGVAYRYKVWDSTGNRGYSQAVTPISGGSHEGTSPAPHMQLRDSNQNVVCSVYNTNPRTAPVATGCPNGTYTQLLWDSNWRELPRRTVTVP